MKTIIITILFFVFYTTAKADTIDYYHVYYNTLKIRQYNLHNINNTNSIITFNRDSIQGSDNLRVKYRRDTGCLNCSSYLILTMANGTQLEEIHSTNNDFSISMNKLLHSLKNLEDGIFKIEYRLDNGEEGHFRYVLFYVKIE